MGVGGVWGVSQLNVSFGKGHDLRVLGSGPVRQAPHSVGVGLSFSLCPSSVATPFVCPCFRSQISQSLKKI